MILLKKINWTFVGIIVKDNQPLSIRNDEGFREFVEELDPFYELPSDKKVKDLLASSYNYCKKEIIGLFEQGVTSLPLLPSTPSSYFTINTFIVFIINTFILFIINTYCAINTFTFISRHHYLHYFLTFLSPYLSPARYKAWKSSQLIRKNHSRKNSAKTRYVYTRSYICMGASFFSLWALYLGIKMSSIRLNCFLRGETVNDIFDVKIDNN
jgi:hypothetical protein